MSLSIADYSIYSVCVGGDTLSHREMLKSLGGSWNRSKRVWIFSKARHGLQVAAYVESVNTPVKTVGLIPKPITYRHPSAITITSPRLCPRQRDMTILSPILQAPTSSPSSETDESPTTPRGIKRKLTTCPDTPIYPVENEEVDTPIYPVEDGEVDTPIYPVEDSDESLPPFPWASLAIIIFIYIFWSGTA